MKEERRRMSGSESAWLDEVLAGLPEPPPKGKPRWVPLCMCGHTVEYHSEYEQRDYLINGCRGATPRRNDPPPTYDPVARKMRLPATCPCTLFRGVAEVDRPGRIFRQQVWTRDDVHPFVRGLRAFRSRLGNMKMVKDANTEFERRYRRIEGTWVCAVCKEAGDSVRPSYVSENRHTQMRCELHRTQASVLGPQQDALSYRWRPGRD